MDYSPSHMPKIPMRCSYSQDGAGRPFPGVAGTVSTCQIPMSCSYSQDGAGRPLPGAAGTVSTPPTPFADRESLEAELLAIEREIGQ
jgi:hypothetical protein